MAAHAYTMLMLSGVLHAKEGWCRCRIELGMPRGHWACKLHLRHMVLAVRCLEWVVAWLSERLWAGLL